MSDTYLMPTRIALGVGALDGIGAAARGLGLGRVLVVTDRAIGAQPFFAAALDSLAEAGVAVALFDVSPCDAAPRTARQERREGRPGPRKPVLGIFRQFILPCFLI